MKERNNTPWHRASWKKFLYEKLPHFLSESVELTGYDIQQTESYFATLFIETEYGRTSFESIPYPDEKGLFRLHDQFILVVPELNGNDLERVECSGELALEFIKERVGSPAGSTPSAGMDGRQSGGRHPGGDDTLKLWFPLERLLDDFFHDCGQILDGTNWLSIMTHLNRVRIAKPSVIWHRCFPGRLDPVECPEGPNMGRVYTVAAGAEIRDSLILPNTGSSDLDLGQASRLIPFFEHTDSARTLMGTNMMRQWLVPDNGELPQVRTGFEPKHVPPLGFNLLTALVSLGADTFGDAIVLSRSAVERMGYADPVGIGDKFSNRHGQKGVISAVYEDDDMPRLPDGRTVELAVSFIGVHARMNFGMVLEATAGLSADFSGTHFTSPPFASPGALTVVQASRPTYCNQEGMVKLNFPQGEGEFYSTVGFVYWGRTKHRGVSKLMGPSEVNQRVGKMEYAALAEGRAFFTAADFSSIQSSEDSGLKKLSEVLAQGEIKVDREDDGLHISFKKPEKGVIPFCPHPWKENRGLYTLPEMGEVGELAERLSRRDLFPALREQLELRMKKAITKHFRELISSKMVSPGNRITDSARSVLAPSESSRSLNELGLPETLYKEFSLHKSESQIILNRAPTFRASSMLALQPYPVAGPAIRLHPLLCHWMNADYDGDQVALYLPRTKKAQEEIGSTLTPDAHLERDPSLMVSLLPVQESLLGLFYLEKKREGKEKIEQVLERNIPSGVFLKKQFEEVYRVILREEGALKLIEKAEGVFRLGLDYLVRRGHSISPLMGEDSYNLEKSILFEIIEGGNDKECRYYNIQRDAVLSGARGSIRSLVQLLGRVGQFDMPEVKSREGESSRYTGLAPQDYHPMAAGMRQGLLVLSNEMYEDKFIRGYNMSMDFNPRGHSFMARAMRSDNPGLVFAHAAENEEIDPLTDPQTAAFCGVLPRNK